MLMWKGNARRSALIGGVLSFISLLALAVPATAGQGAGNPAGISGVVTDNTGALLPGVTVTATSPALQVPSVTSVSDARGEYRLSPLPIGLYTVLFELTGFQSVRREGVRLTVGFTARVDSELNVGGVAETITVSGASPLVDATSTATSTELTREQLEVLPTSRDGYQAFLNQVPGVRTNQDVGASGLGDTVQFRVYGQIGSPWQMLEGVMMSSPDDSAARGSHVDFTAIEGTRVQTVGSNAEMPRRGLLIDAVVKSGGNDFHGAVMAYGSSPKLEANNINDTLKAAGIRHAKMHTNRDLSTNMGGRIIANKLWFFGGARYQEVAREILDAFDSDGTPIVNVRKGPYLVGKGSYQVSPQNSLVGFFHWTDDYELRNATRFVPRESMEEKHGSTSIRKVQWQAVRGNGLVASVQYGFFDVSPRQDGIAPEKIPTMDIATLFVTGNAFTDGGRSKFGRHHTKGVISWYKPDLLGGNHEFKAGVDHLWSFNNAGLLGPRYRLIFNAGTPFQLQTRNGPVDGVNLGNYIGVYGQDSWTLARRLTLNLGLRVEHDAAHMPQQCRVAAEFAAAACWDKVSLVTFNSLAPRAHVAFDISGDGKTVIKGGYGRFNQLREVRPDVTNLNQNLPLTTTWDWHDNNGNKQYDPGEVNLDPKGSDFRSIGGGSLGVVNPNEKQPKTDEFSLTFERELVANTAMRVTGVYSRNFNAYGLSEISREGQYTIPVTNLDPGPDGRLGTADDTGRSITYYEYPASLGSAAFAQTMLVNNPAADSTYKSFEIGATKRPFNKWQLNASYTTTWLNIPITCGFAAGTGLVTTRCPTNPNTAINSANITREWQAKLSGAYDLPYGFQTSVNYDLRSGFPQARQVLFTGGSTIRSIVLNVEPIGSIVLPNTHELDVRVAKRVNLGAARSLELRADIYNVLNHGTVMSRDGASVGSAQTLLSGANYLRPGSIQFPRVLQIGVTFTY
jgi:Carboxypeptidase regulatory-like domain/TonB dependent receptor